MNQAANAFGVVGTDFPRVGVEYIHAFHTHANSSVLLILDVDVGLTKHDKEIPFARILQLVGHVKVGVHLGFKDWQRPKLGQLGGMRIEIEGTGDHDVEPGIGRLARRIDEIGARHRAEFRAEKDRGAALVLPSR